MDDIGFLDAMMVETLLATKASGVYNDRRSVMARVAELVDALDLGSSGVTCESSSLSSRTIYT